jgi:hypothetical protein
VEERVLAGWPDVAKERWVGGRWAGVVSGKDQWLGRRCTRVLARACMFAQDMVESCHQLS